VKLLLDMNLSPRWAAWFAAEGIRAVHWSMLGAPNAPDEAIMAFARAEGYVVLTHDLDFSAILAATKGEKPSVVQIRSDDLRPESIGGLVVQALRQTQGELETGALLTVDTRRARVRLLPL
jgi:predicted nuclease of predicted toxin-antitoxin system